MTLIKKIPLKDIIFANESPENATEFKSPSTFYEVEGIFCIYREEKSPFGLFRPRVFHGFIREEDTYVEAFGQRGYWSRWNKDSSVERSLLSLSEEREVPLRFLVSLMAGSLRIEGVGCDSVKPNCYALFFRGDSSIKDNLRSNFMSRNV
jgi:hypothetical protein